MVATIRRRGGEKLLFMINGVQRGKGVTRKNLLMICNAAECKIALQSRILRVRPGLTFEKAVYKGSARRRFCSISSRRFRVAQEKAGIANRR